MRTIPHLATCLLIALSPSLTLADAIDDYVQQQMTKQRIPGLSLAVVQSGRIIKARGYGFADTARNIPARPETVYHLGSIGKQFTAAAIMVLVEQGKLSLDDPISRYVTHIPDAWKPATIRQLLTHTSGIKCFTDQPNILSHWHSPATIDQVLQLVANEPLGAPPGQQWAYSNTNYVLLGLAIEKVSGQSYDSFMRDRILKPLQMSSSYLYEPDSAIPNLAVGYTLDGDRVRPANPVHPAWAFAAGSILSTITDLATWDAALSSEKLLKKSSLTQMWTPAKLNDNSTYPYGFGFALRQHRGHPVVEHAGGIAGYTCYICRFPNDQLTIILLCNTDRMAPEIPVQEIAGLVNPALSLFKKPPSTRPN